MSEEHTGPLEWNEEGQDAKSQRHVSVRISVEGKVQGVGYRNWLRAKAQEKQIDGWVRNRSDGRLEALFSGKEVAVRELISLCYQGPPAAYVKRIREYPESGLRPDTQGFMVLPTI
jgi:acylphosphatase